MNIKDITSILNAHKGANKQVVFTKTLKTRKGITDTIVKTTCAVVRGGIDYENLNAVKQAREEGIMPETAGELPWGQWTNFPFAIEHKGTDYVRLYPSSLKSQALVVTYRLNGEVISKEAIESLCLASEFSKGDSDKPKCFTIKADNIVSIG